jgi:hypothetical protein
MVMKTLPANSIVGSEELGHYADSREAYNKPFTVHHTAL